MEGKRSGISRISERNGVYTVKSRLWPGLTGRGRSKRAAVLDLAITIREMARVWRRHRWPMPRSRRT